VRALKMIAQPIMVPSASQACSLCLEPNPKNGPFGLW
jgi:hypothetical protein